MEYSEPELVIPTLEILSVLDNLNTSKIMTLLREELQPTGSDLLLLEGRNDDRFSQKVRNLTGSHHTLENKGLATLVDGQFSITDEGLEYLKENKGVSDAIEAQGFDFKDRRKLAETDFKNVLIEEGSVNQVSKKVRERSKKLINFARNYFAKDGKIVCIGCGFEGGAVYGEQGEGLIEIHHQIPLHLVDEEGEEKQLEDAVKETAPLCPNCHRLVHRKKENLLSITDLQALTGYTVPA